MCKETPRCSIIAAATAGFERPQDCKVTVQLKTEGGISIRLHGANAHMFDRSIRQSAEDALRKLDVFHADVELMDFDSLDFTIRARVATAVRRAVCELQKAGAAVE